MFHRESRILSFTFDIKTLEGSITQDKNGFAWRFNLSAAGGVHCGQPDPMYAEAPWKQHCRAIKSLKSLKTEFMQDHRETESGVELDFKMDGAYFRLDLSIGPEPEAFCFQLIPLDSGATDIVAAELPGAIFPAADSGIQVLADYRHQGRLFTGSAGAIETEVPELRELRMGDGRHRMRFFGVLGDRKTIGKARSGYTAIIEENADAEIVLKQAGNGALSCHPAFLPCMGTISYARKVRYLFTEDATIAKIAKTFRKYAIQSGLYKSLKEKAEERPLLKQLPGSTACFIGYNQDDADYPGTLRTLRGMGHRKFFVFPTFHINPGIESPIGSFIDIKKAIPSLKKESALTGSWTWLSSCPPNQPAALRFSLKNADQTSPLNWRIGDALYYQSCPRAALQVLDARTRDFLEADAHHFDTTTSNALLECYDLHHPMDRRGDRAFRIEQFKRVLSLGKIVSSEGVKDWAVPFYDIGSNKEIPVKSETPAFRVVPLTHLVYHDALFFLWWEVDTYDCAHWLGGDLPRQSLADLLYGDMPLIFPAGAQYRWASKSHEEAVMMRQSLDLPACLQAAKRAVPVADHFGDVAMDEMTDFQFLSEDGAVQETYFSGGTRVSGNFKMEPWPLSNGRVLRPLDALIARE